MSIARKILSNTAFQVAGRAGVGLLSLISIKIITHYLGKESYGEYTNVYEFLALFAIIADFGLYTIAVREMSKNEEKTPKILGNILSIRLLVGIIVMAAVIFVGFLVPKHQGTAMPYAIMIATSAALVGLINGTVTSVLQVKYKMKYAAQAQIVGKIVQISYMALAAFVFFNQDKVNGFYHLFVAGVIGNFMMLLYTLYRVSKYSKIKFRFDWNIIKYLLKQSAPYGLALFLSNVYFRADVLIIFNIRGDLGSEEAGLYGVAARLLEALVILPLFFMNAVLPTLTKHIKEKSDKYKQIIQYVFDFQLMLTLPFVVGGFILAAPLVRLISKDEFVSGYTAGFVGSDAALQVILFSLILVAMNVIFNFTLIAIGKQVKLVWINGICAMFNIIANLIIIPIMGFVGAAYTTIASELLVFILVFYTAKHYLPFTIKLGRTFKVVISALAMGIVVYLLKEPTFALIQNANILLLIPIGALVYGGSLLATKAVTKDLIAMIRR